MTSTKPRKRLSKLQWTAFVLTAILLYYVRFYLGNLSWNGSGMEMPTSMEDSAGFVLENEVNWDNFPPSHRLNWKDCYPGKQCARLIVPLNYSEPEGDIAIIALIRKPASVPKDSDDYRGPVLINPGGPGGSGVAMVFVRGDSFSDILGPQFDIVGFDPRGVGRSTPQVSFFETSAERALWGSSPFDVLNTSVALTERWARAKIKGQLALERDELNYLRHINTDQTARDMLRITQAHGRDKIQYWGFSYGSILGASFASMFPNNIERLAIDGVADAENYFESLWSNSLIDTDKTLQSFFDSCSKAGPDGCPFYAPTPDDIAKNLTAILNSIQKVPIPVRTDTSYGLLDYKRLKTTIFNSLYKPYATFPLLARGLADLAVGEATALYKMSEEPIFQCSCSPPKDTPQNILEVEGGIATGCNDGKRVSGSHEAALDYYNMMIKESQWGEIWVAGRIDCGAWPDLPKNHFQGPFFGNTSHPILLIGNTADPVTPLWAAKKMSRGFKDSVVLTQDSPGHCSLTAPSLCTQRYIREYFQDGTLPKAGTVCSVDEEIFPSPKEAVVDSQVHLSELDSTLLQSIKSISSSYSIPLGPLAVPW